MKQVLYITYDGLTDPLGQSQVLPYLRLLSQHGYQFTIISFEKKSRFKKDGKVVQSIAAESNINWIPLNFTANPPVLAKIYDRWRMWKTATTLHKKKSFSLIHCRSYVAAEVGLRMKQKFGVKMLFDMRGFWADEKVDNGQWNQKKFFYRQLYRYYKEKEKEFLLRADGIVSLTQAAKDYLLLQPVYKQLSIDVIPCCADLEHFNYAGVEPLSVQKLRAELNIPDRAKVITYLGSIGGWYMIKEMLLFFKILLQKYPEYILLMLTKDKASIVQQEAASVGIAPEKIIITYSDRERLPLFLSLSSCSLFFIRNTFSKVASSPTKHAELMGMGIPVICNSIGDTGNIITDTGTGLLVNQFDDQSLYAAAEQIGNLERLNKEYIRNYAREYFDLDTGARKYLSLYRRILAPCDAPVNTDSGFA